MSEEEARYVSAHAIAHNLTAIISVFSGLPDTELEPWNGMVRDGRGG